MQVRKKMQFLTRDSIQLRRDVESNKIETVVGNHCSVGYVVRIIARGIVYSIIVVVEPRYRVLRRRIQLVMLVIPFLGYMELWSIGRGIIKYRLLRWIVSFVIKLFLFLLIMDLTIFILILTWWISVV